MSYPKVGTLLYDMWGTIETGSKGMLGWIVAVEGNYLVEWADGRRRVYSPGQIRLFISDLEELRLTLTDPDNLVE